MQNYPFNCLALTDIHPGASDRVHIWIVSSRQMVIEWIAFFFLRNASLFYSVFVTGTYHDIVQ